MERNHRFPLFFFFVLILSIISISSLASATSYTLVLEKGWNAISVPYVDFSIIGVDPSILVIGYTYNPLSSSYEQVKITDASLIKNKGVWVYSNKAHATILIEGKETLTKEWIKFSARLDKDYTFNFIAVPKNGVSTSELKDKCSKIKRVIYFNATDGSWYTYDFSTFELKKGEEVLKKGEVIFPEGYGIFVEVGKECQKFSWETKKYEGEQCSSNDECVETEGIHLQCIYSQTHGFHACRYPNQLYCKDNDVWYHDKRENRDYLVWDCKYECSEGNCPQGFSACCKVPAGEKCSVNEECESGVCCGGKCCAKGQGCSLLGTCSGKAPIGENCKWDTDCESNFCYQGKCTDPSKLECKGNQVLLEGTPIFDCSYCCLTTGCPEGWKACCASSKDECQQIQPTPTVPDCGKGYWGECQNSPGECAKYKRDKGWMYCTKYDKVYDLYCDSDCNAHFCTDDNHKPCEKVYQSRVNKNAYCVQAGGHWQWVYEDNPIVQQQCQIQPQPTCKEYEAPYEGKCVCRDEACDSVCKKNNRGEGQCFQDSAHQYQYEDGCYCEKPQQAPQPQPQPQPSVCEKDNKCKGYQPLYVHWDKDTNSMDLFCDKDCQPIVCDESNMCKEMIDANGKRIRCSWHIGPYGFFAWWWMPSDYQEGGMACSDRRDNDCDGKIDCQDDSCCSYPECWGKGVCSYPQSQAQKAVRAAGYSVPEVTGKEKYVLRLKKGWNMVAIPYKKYRIAEKSDKVYSVIYSWDPAAEKFKTDKIEKGKTLAFSSTWIYSFVDGGTVVIEGEEKFTKRDISLNALSTKIDTPNQLGVPENIHLISERGNCEITRFYYWSPEEGTWYKWNATTKMLLRYNFDTKMYENVGEDPDPLLSAGSAVYIYVKHPCSLGMPTGK